jgi:hypothetical protein
MKYKVHKYKNYLFLAPKLTSKDKINKNKKNKKTTIIKYLHTISLAFTRKINFSL